VTSNCNYSTTTLLEHDTPTVNSSDSDKRTIINSSIASSSLKFENTSEISKFQMENISNTTLFDPGLCHNSSILNSIIMEADCAELGMATGQLRHIMEDIFEDAENDENQVDIDSANNTNQDVLNYFQRVSNHY
jgi:hypothetical protein